MAQKSWDNLSRGDVLEPRLLAAWDEESGTYVNLTAEQFATVRVVSTKTGSRVITGTGTVTGEWTAIKAVEGNATIASVVSSTFTNDSELDGLVISDTDTIFGVFTSITLTSGKVIAFA